MNRIIDFVKVRHTNAMNRTGAVNPVPRWRSIFMALILALALVVGSAGQTPPAQAAPSSKTEYVYFVFATNQGRDNATICVGDNVLISVKVVRLRIEDNNVVPEQQKISGIWVEGSMQDPSIGKLIMARKVTGWNSDQPGIAVFAFHADKPGKTTLTFKAEIHYYRSILYKWLYGKAEISESEPVDVNVKVCNYKVTTISHWNNDVGGIYVAMMDETKMTADAQSHYTGSASVNWVGTFMMNGCPEEYTITPDQADLTGELDDNGQLVATLTYQPSAVTWSGICGNTSGWDKFQVSQNPLRFSVPSYGGVTTLAQVLVGSGEVGSFNGSVVITVVRQSEQASALNADKPLAWVGSPSPWWATGWDGFPWLFSTLLALR